jgi:hypothetical protein
MISGGAVSTAHAGNAALKEAIRRKVDLIVRIRMPRKDRLSRPPVNGRALPQ